MVIPLHDENPTHRFAWVTVLLIIINIAVFVWIQPRSDTGEGIEFSFRYAAIPCEVVEGRPLTLPEIADTYNGDANACQGDAAQGPTVFESKRPRIAIALSMFLHGDWLHLGFNMLFLWIFGNNVEDHLGKVRYIAFYVAGGVIATLAHVAVQTTSTVPIIGASGAIAAVMGAYLVWFPNARVRTLLFFLLILFVQIRAKYLLIVWLASQFLLADNSSGVAWMAHVGGFVYGVIVALAVRESMAARRVLWRQTYGGDDQGFWDTRHGGRSDNPLPPYNGPVS